MLVAPLVDHAFFNQAAQQAVGRGLRQANPLRQLADLLALATALSQRTQHGEQTRHCTDTYFLGLLISFIGIHFSSNLRKFQSVE
ncbi:hypothetical protein PPS11_41265 [Pseudomonas putida S11]|nr:hypothetical protein PPS11_41265 [Pseudomonas putida S11]